MKIEFGFWTWGRELREERGGVTENSCMEWVVAAAVKERRTRGGGKCCYGQWCSSCVWTSFDVMSHVCR